MQSKHHRATAAQESIIDVGEYATPSKHNNGKDTDSMRLTSAFDAGDRQYHPNRMQ